MRLPRRHRRGGLAATRVRPLARPALSRPLGPGRRTPRGSRDVHGASSLISRIPLASRRRAQWQETGGSQCRFGVAVHPVIGRITKCLVSHGRPITLTRLREGAPRSSMPCCSQGLDSPARGADDDQQPGTTLQPVDSHAARRRPGSTHVRRRLCPRIRTLDQRVRAA